MQTKHNANDHAPRLLAKSSLVQVNGGGYPRTCCLSVGFSLKNQRIFSPGSRMASNGTMYKVFVYGTLKRGEPNHNWFTKSTGGHHKFLYEGRTKEKFPLIIATRFNIPFLLYAPGKGHNVKGEVYEVDEKVLQDLDILEDHPDYYVRERYDVERISEEKTTEKVWIYMIKTFKKELLDQTCFEEYSNYGSHGLRYVGRYLLEDKSDDHITQLFPQEKNK